MLFCFHIDVQSGQNFKYLFGSKFPDLLSVGFFYILLLENIRIVSDLCTVSEMLAHREG